MIFNTHSHLNDKIETINDILNQCRDLGVGKIAAIGYDYKSSLRALELSKTYDCIYAVCGLQPEEVIKNEKSIEDFKKIIIDSNCTAIGEIGLDYYYGKENKELQLLWFEKFLKLACETKKPIVIHCRDSHEDMFNLLEKYHNKLNGIIMHCYTGSVEMMNRYLSLGAYISVSGIVTFKNAKTIKDVVINCPLERLLVETDDPYLTPVPYRGKENKPAYVYYVVEEVAKLKGLSFKEIEEATYNNAKKVFQLWRKSKK